MVKRHREVHARSVMRRPTGEPQIVLEPRSGYRAPLIYMQKCQKWLYLSFLYIREKKKRPLLTWERFIILLVNGFERF